MCGSAPHLLVAKVNEKCGASRVVLEVTRCKGWVVCLVTSVCHNKHTLSNKACNAHRDVGYSNKESGFSQNNVFQTFSVMDVIYTNPFLRDGDVLR